MFYKEKIVISGDIIEYYIYEKEQLCDYEFNKSSGRTGTATDEQKGENRTVVYQRAKRTVRRLINANVWQYKDHKERNILPKFFTLTFADNVTDLKLVNYEWKKFILRLGWYTKSKLKYVVVVEFQDRGAIHYHAVFFNLPYIKKDKLTELWGQGWIKINAVKEVDNVGAYVIKYMNKDLKDDRLKGEKCYFSSRGLYKPTEIKNKWQIDCVLTAIPANTKKKELTFNNDYTGNIEYTQYNISEQDYIRVNSNIS